jgi:two-component system response regulator RegX3
MPMQTILVIDDDETLRDTIGLLLEREGFRAVLAADGESGLEQATLGNPALILTDLRLPGLTGVEVCKRVRASGIETPIIVLSAVGEEIDQALLLEMGADDYVAKPFGTRELLAHIRGVMRRAPDEQERVPAFADAHVDIERRVVTRRGREIEFTPAE